MATDIEGYWYDGQQSGRQAARVSVDHRGYMQVIAIDELSARPSTRRIIASCPLTDITISNRLGNSSRYLYFTEGQKFETRDNDGVDRIVSQFKINQGGSLLYHLETRWRYVIVATLLMIVVGYWSAVHGVPLAAKSIASLLPDVVAEKASEQTMALMDEEMMQPSELDSAIQQRVTGHFATIIQQHPEQNLQVLFRKSDLGANAFALPDGTIVFTDEMVLLAEDDDELLSVMAHEVGHVVHQHGMRGLVQASLVSFLLMLMTGDVSGASELFLGIPVILNQLSYSRAFEREADDYALNYMLAEGIPTSHFSNLMSRVQASYCEELGNCGQEEQVWQQYLSTHPALEERIEKFRDSNE